MASITKNETKDGTSYHVNIRFKGINETKTFYTEEDAKLYEFYKERLLKNMENFEVPLSKTVTLNQIYELKLKYFNHEDRRSVNSFYNSLQRFNEIFGNKFYCDITYEDWVNAAKILYATPVYKGAKTENGKRHMSVKTLRNIFAYASSAVSFAQEKGIELENHPAKVIKVYIASMVKKENEILPTDTSEDRVPCEQNGALE